MIASTMTILLIALLLDWYFGEPEILWSRLPHPVVLFGRSVGIFDRRLNRQADAPERQYRKGALAIGLLALIALISALLIQSLLALLGPVGWTIECLIVFVLLAQRSLYDHVSAVATGIREDGLAGGRAAVGLIVGRDPQLLDTAGVCRAAIETLAENFSDGVVAPAFWYAVFGLPGLFVYKMINTADSMIAYRSEKYLYFGRATARIDDLANWLPARLSAIILAVGAIFVGGAGALSNSFATALRDSGLHRSPNAGWPEAAMAGAVNVALGGPRVYREETVAQAFINASGRRISGARDIDASLACFKAACFVLWTVVALLALVW